MKGGLSSGEGLINEVRDEVKKWNGKDGTWEVVDPGVSDKRLMVNEPEFAGALLAADRHGNLLSPIIRKAWDGGKLETLTKSSPALRYQPAYLNRWSHNSGGVARSSHANRLCKRVRKPLPVRPCEALERAAVWWGPGRRCDCWLNERLQGAVEIASRGQEG